MIEFVIASKLMHIASMMVLFGAPLFRLYVGGAASPAQDAFDLWLRRILLIAALLALLSAVAWWDSLAVTMGEGWPDALNREVLAAILFETEFGRVWVWRLALAAILFGALIVLRRCSPRTKWTGVIVALAAALLLSLAPVGHAPREAALAELVHLAAKALHLGAAATWLGGLLPLGYIVARAARSGDSAWVELAFRALSRFSLVGYFAVGLILLSGCIVAWSQLDDPANLAATLYGRVLLAKVALFLLMVGIAAFNRLILTAPSLDRAPATLPVLAKSLVVEQAIGLSILLTASILATLSPTI